MEVKRLKIVGLVFFGLKVFYLVLREFMFFGCWGFVVVFFLVLGFLDLWL